MKLKLTYLALLPLSFHLAAIEEPVNEMFQPYWYAGAGIGQGHYSNGGNELSHDSVRNRFAGSVYLGYQFNPYFSPELSYQYLGSAYAYYPQGEVRGDFQQVTLAARLGYPLTQSLYPYVKVGAAGWFGESSGLRSGSEQGFSPIVGAGLEYAFTSRLTGRLEYQYTDSLGADSIGFTNHHLTTLGFSWRFGLSEPVSIPAPEKAELPPIPTIVERRQIVYSEQKNSNLFALNSSILNNTSALDAAVSFLQTHSNAVADITGYSDNTGTDKYNLWLSERRAQAVATYLASQGIAAERLTVDGRGKQNPIADNDNEAGRAMNRRVEIVIPEFTVLQADTEK